MQSQFPDLANPIYGRKELAGDFWVGYRRRVFKRIDRRLPLNVRNAYVAPVLQRLPLASSLPQ